MKVQIRFSGKGLILISPVFLLGDIGKAAAICLLFTGIDSKGFANLHDKDAKGKTVIDGQKEVLSSLPKLIKEHYKAIEDLIILVNITPGLGLGTSIMADYAENEYLQKLAEKSKEKIENSAILD